MLGDQSLADSRLAEFLELCSALTAPLRPEGETWLERSRKWRQLLQVLQAEDVQRSPVCGYAAMTTAFVFISTAKLQSQHEVAAIAAALEAISLLLSRDRSLGPYLLLQRRNARFEPAACIDKVLFTCVIVAERTCPDEKSARRATASEEEQLTACLACLAAHIQAATNPAARLPPEVVLLSTALAARLPGIMKGTFVAQVVHLCVHKCSQFRSPDIKRRGLEALLLLIDGLEHASDLWRAYFPGIFGALYKLCKDPASSAVLEMSVTVLLQVIAVVTGDRVNEKLVAQHGDVVANLMQRLQTGSRDASDAMRAEPPGAAGENKAEYQQADGVPVVAQNDEWRNDLLQRLEKYLYPLLRDVVSYTSATWRVKVAVVRGLERLLTGSKLFLQPQFNKLLGVVVGLSTDSNDDVCAEATRAIENVRLALDPSEWAAVRSAMVSQLSDLLAEAVALANAAKTAELGHLLGTCIGLVNTLQTDVRLLLSIEEAQTMSRLRHLFEVDPAGLHLQPLELRSFQVHPSVSTKVVKVVEVGVYRIPLKHAFDASVEKLARRLCYALSAHVPLEQTAKYFMSKLAVVPQQLHRQPREKIVRRLEKRAALINTALAFMNAYSAHLTQTASSGAGHDEGTVHPARDPRSVIHRLALLVQQAVNEDHPDGGFEVSRAANTVQNLGLELLGACSALLAPDVQPLMKDVLYAVVEKVGSPNQTTAQAATATLTQFALADRGKAIAQLLADNMDYLVEQICHQLRPSMGGLRSKGQLPAVIAGVLRHAEGAVALPLLREVISQTLQGVDQHYPSMTEDQMGSLVRLMEVMVKHAAGTAVLREGPHPSTSPVSAVEEAKQLLQAYVAARAQELAPEPNQTPAHGGDSDDEDLNPPPTPSNQLILDILQRSSYFLSVPSLKVQVQVLELMAKAMQVLAAQESALLPAVHSYWPTVMSRLRHEAMRDRPSMLLPALLQYIGVLCDLCGDFLSFKFREDLWPLLWHILGTVSGVRPGTRPRRKVSRSAALLALENDATTTNPNNHSQSPDVDTFSLDQHVFSAQVKVEKALVSVLDKFATARDCRPYVLSVVPAISVRLLSFLGSTRHAVVRAATEQLFVHLMALDSDYVWCLLHPITVASQQHTAPKHRKDLQLAGKVWQSAHADPRAINAHAHLHQSPLSNDLIANAIGGPPPDLLSLGKDQVLVQHVWNVLRRHASAPSGLHLHLRNLLRQ